MRARPARPRSRAGAIQDNDRGTIIGTRTFGTGTVLNTLELSDGSAVRLGVERWLTPDGRLIFDTGIEPDEVVELPLDGLTVSPGDLQTMTPEQLADLGRHPDPSSHRDPRASSARLARILASCLKDAPPPSARP